jgi:hypothetical protein
LISESNVNDNIEMHINYKTKVHNIVHFLLEFIVKKIFKLLHFR